ncbi:MAG TPA: M55 family metallopeptidase [Candidatus Hydrogenedentes bacterium]|nr:M55 family metallopeptidase [Candidatus Hydrogenedentota bacterium]HPG66828.1 M55 family metallopeptidase [Candidatus Hydrogenedentota bacterium]
MKVLMCTDQEGVAGVVSFEPQSYPDGRFNNEARHLLTAEVNAAIEGMIDEGVDEVLVVDGHGPGAIWFEDLHPKAKLMHGRPCGHRAARDEVFREYDATIMVGQHAMAGVRTGNQNHTQSSRAIDYIKLNGEPIGEIAQWALYQGAFGLPLIFLSGDEAACREAEALVPGIVTAAVKRGIGRNAAVSLSATAARALIRERMAEAVRRHRESPLAPVVRQGPFVIEKRFFHTDVADGAAGAPDIERVDSQTIRFRGEKIQDVIFR